MKNRFSRFLAASLLGVGAVGTASAIPVNLIENGSFEENIVAPNTWKILSDKEMIAWDVKGLGVEIRDNVAGAAYDGNNFVELDTTKNSWISQTFKTIANQTYLLSFFYSPRMDVAANSNTIEVLIDEGQPVMSVEGDGRGASGNVWQEYTYNFVADDDSTTLKFRAGGISDSVGGSLDKVSVFAVGDSAAVGQPTPIPEPATWSIMLAGLAGAWTVSRRRAR